MCELPLTSGPSAPLASLGKQLRGKDWWQNYCCNPGGSGVIQLLPESNDGWRGRREVASFRCCTKFSHSRERMPFELVRATSCRPFHSSLPAPFPFTPEYQWIFTCVKYGQARVLQRDSTAAADGSQICAVAFIWGCIPLCWRQGTRSLQGSLLRKCALSFCILVLNT